MLALIATFYQLYLQRRHDEKSVKPLAQINLTDHNGLIYVHVQNNGLGPLIVEQLVFEKDGKVYYDIRDCLNLDPRHYQYVPINEAVNKVIPKGAHLEVFSKQFDLESTAEELNDVRRNLAALILKVEGRDMYDKRVIVERELKWFVRHL